MGTTTDSGQVTKYKIQLTDNIGEKERNFLSSLNPKTINTGFIRLNMCFVFHSPTNEPLFHILTRITNSSVHTILHVLSLIKLNLY